MVWFIISLLVFAVDLYLLYLVDKKKKGDGS